MAVGAKFTNGGFNVVLNRAYSASPTADEFSEFKIGTGTTTPTVSDTGLATAITGWYSGGDSKPFESSYGTNGVSFDTANLRVTWLGIVSFTEANSNSITEVGDINAGGTLGGRFVHSGITKDSSVQVKYYITYVRGT